MPHLHPKRNPPKRAGRARVFFRIRISGIVAKGSIYGPYLADLPANPLNGRWRIRIDGAPAGANTHGWRFNFVKRVIEPDDDISAAGGLAVSGSVRDPVVKEAPAMADPAIAAD